MGNQKRSFKKGHNSSFQSNQNSTAPSSDKLVEFLKHTVGNLGEAYLLNLAELAALKETHLKKQLVQAQQTIQNYNAVNKKPSAHDEKFLDVWKDPKTKLMWTRSPLAFGKTYTWNDAISACKQCSIAGYSDWRLPTIEELQTLMIKDEMGYACSKGALLELAQDKWGTYWSINRSDATIKVANFNTGRINYIRNESNVYLVRAVRNLK